MTFPDPSDEHTFFNLHFYVVLPLACALLISVSFTVMSWMESRSLRGQQASHHAFWEEKKETVDRLNRYRKDILELSAADREISRWEKDRKDWAEGLRLVQQNLQPGHQLVRIRMRSMRPDSPSEIIFDPQFNTTPTPPAQSLFHPRVVFWQVKGQASGSSAKVRLHDSLTRINESLPPTLPKLESLATDIDHRLSTDELEVYTYWWRSDRDAVEVFR